MDLIILSVFFALVLGMVFYLLIDEKRVHKNIVSDKDSMIKDLLIKNSDLTDKIYFVRKDEYLSKKALEMPLEDLPKPEKSEEVGIPLGDADPFEIIEEMSKNK